MTPSTRVVSPSSSVSTLSMGIQSNCPTSLPNFAQLSMSSPSVRPLSLPDGDPSSGSTSHIREIARGHNNEQKNLHTQDKSLSNRCGTAISMLPDDVLLEIFDSYRNNNDYYFKFLRPLWKWHVLVHVCQRWRQVVFASSHRLKLQILCTSGTPVRKNLNIWPVFPIVLDFYSSSHLTPNDEGNVITILEHPNRVCSVRLYVTGLQLGRMIPMMQEPFPVLTRLYIVSRDRTAPVFPAKFSGGSAPCLREIALIGIPYPALPTLLLSTCDLVTLMLHNIPPTGYIPPKTMAACLAALPKLETLHIEFQLVTPRDQKCPLPVTRTILPALTTFRFQGASGYLEDLVAQIDGPQLNRILTVHLNWPVDLQVAQLSTFVNRSVGPFRHVYICFHSNGVTFTLNHHANYPGWDRRRVLTTISTKLFLWHVSHMAQVLSQFSATLSNVVHLKLEVHLDLFRRSVGAGDFEWLHLRQFSAVQTLHVSQEISGHVALALEDVTAEMAAEVLQSLHLIFLAGQPTSSIEKFIAVRRLCGRPVTVIETETEYARLVSCQ